MLLAEGTIIIPRNERQRIYAFVAALKSFLTPRFEQGLQDAEVLVHHLNKDFSPEWDEKVGKNLYHILFEYERNKHSGVYYADYQTIYLNLLYLGVGRIGNGGKILLSGVKYDELTSVLMHEFAHYKRDMKIRSQNYGHMLVQTPPKDLAAHFKNPDEHLAWAVGYLEKLKTKAKVSKPEEILSLLRSVGLLHDPMIHALKKTDYDSWKAIMKHVIRTVMADLLRNNKSKKSVSSTD